MGFYGNWGGNNEDFMATGEEKVGIVWQLGSQIIKCSSICLTGCIWYMKVRNKKNCGVQLPDGRGEA